MVKRFSSPVEVARTPITGSPECGRFEQCNASICPVLDWRRQAHLRGEAVCHHLKNSGKQGTTERFRGDPTFHACVSELPAITARWPDIGRKVAKAARSGFRGANLISMRSDLSGVDGPDETPLSDLEAA